MSICNISFHHNQVGGRDLYYSIDSAAVDFDFARFFLQKKQNLKADLTFCEFNQGLCPAHSVPVNLHVGLKGPH